MQCRCSWAAAPANSLATDAALIPLALLRLVCCSEEQLSLNNFYLNMAKQLSHPLGNTQNYLLASSPALLGFLWAVTDADVDQWTVVFLQVFGLLIRTVLENMLTI